MILETVNVTESFPDMDKLTALAREAFPPEEYLPTEHFLSYLGVDYEIFCTDRSFDLDEFRELMSHLKIDGFYPKYFEK